ncbi:MAG: N-acetyltransferase family protein [Anaerofustis sp.]
MQIRAIEKRDAAELMELKLTLARETDTMLLEADERHDTKKSVREEIAESELSGSLLIGAFDGADLVGYLSAERGIWRKIRHSAYITIGILPAYQGQKIGTQFFEKLDAWATDNEITRLELTVMAHNERGIALYRKAGFVTEGTKRNALMQNGQYIDEYSMAKVTE